MVQEEQLPALQAALLRIAAEIDRVCRKNDIPYSLIYGSLLGAVRHRGFIPWDDDMDLGMLREEYERFLAACETDLDPAFELQTCRNDESYPYGFAKVLLRGTRCEMAGHEGEAWQRGVFVDVFPMDAVPADPGERGRFAGRVYVWRKLLERRSGLNIGRGSPGKALAFRLLGGFSRLFSHRAIAARLEREMRRYEERPTGLVCCLCDARDYDRETFSADSFRDLTDCEFEGLTLRMVRDYDTWLTAVYGDYMTPPPPEERRQTHSFVRLELDVPAERPL